MMAPKTVIRPICPWCVGEVQTKLRQFQHKIHYCIIEREKALPLNLNFISTKSFTRLKTGRVTSTLQLSLNGKK